MSKSTPKNLDEANASNIRDRILTGVGYGKPPGHTRFKKGQSGNPSGRPPKIARDATATAMSDLLLAEADRLVTVVENGQERDITAREAVVKASFKAAVRGNSFAQERLLSRIEKAERERSARIEAANEHAADYIAACRVEIELARANGMPEPKHYPHPDDLIIEPGEPWRLVGPATREQAAKFERAARIRDLLYLQSVLAPHPRTDQVSIEMLTASLIDAHLPPRMRRNDSGWFELKWRERRTSRRVLAKKIRHGWRGIGVEIPRGATFPLLDLQSLMLQL